MENQSAGKWNKRGDRVETGAYEEIKISVRELVEFILRGGDIDNRHHGSPENAMQEGGRIHRLIQRRMGPEYQAEVTLKYTHPTDRYVLVLEGRADGVVNDEKGVMIDEIKGTYRDLEYMTEPVGVHLAQAKCYAYMYSLRREDLQCVRVRMTYCQMETEEIRYFTREYSVQELRAWFEGVVGAYLKWADYRYDWKRRRDASIRRMEFPFSYREGQKELVTYVYQTIYHGKKLFLEAPTGVGKTVSTVFPAVKALERGLGERIFYLTAKTITRTVAEDTFSLLRANGLQFKSVILTARDKICFMEKAECNPDVCPYARGHFDRVNEAMYDMLLHEDSFSRDKIEEYAKKYQVCPFEFCLDMSLYADGIIGDYNYLFDPHVYLKRFFSEGAGNNYIFLIDEAHNLLDRGREMYSAALVKEEFLSLKHALDVKSHSEDKKQGLRSTLYVQGHAAKIEKLLEKCNQELLTLKRECGESRVVQDIDAFVQPLLRLYGAMEAYLEEREEGAPPAKEELLELYYKISHFLDIYERLDEKYVKYTELTGSGEFTLKLFCVDPSGNLQQCMKRGRSSILFSATFLPIQYYKRLLGGEDSDYEVYARSVFDPGKRALFIAEDVTSKYTRRSDTEYYNIAHYINQIVKNRKGNYMVFCPSYYFLQKVYERYLEIFADEETECILQSDYMTEGERELFLSRFEGNPDCDLSVICMDIEEEADKTLIGFCVLGGIFSEGIDLKQESLIGAIIVGTGLPQVCFERQLLKLYFDGLGENGFDYSYRFPGMNKVLQAAGRVIRTTEDEGIIALLDERFLQNAYLRLFPREWNRYEVINLQNAAKKVEGFWKR